MTMFALVYTTYLMHHPVYIYIQFIVYKCLSKKIFQKNHIRTKSRVRGDSSCLQLETRYSLEALEAHGPLWAGLQG